MTTISEINKQIAACNPYDDKETRSYLVGLRCKLEQDEKNQQDIKNGDLPAMLQKQAGL